MPEKQKRIARFRNSHLQTAGILLLLLLAALMLWHNNASGIQAISATAAQIRFEGEYRIGDGQWQTVVEGQHIPATKGDVTLRGNFHMYSPGGEYIGLFKRNTHIAFYTDHIGLTFCDGESGTYVIDNENPLFGGFACGENWTAHMFSGDGTQPVEIVVHNPHRFGNENAVDEMLSGIALWGNIDFEKEILSSGQTQRNTGLFFVIVAFVLLGSALFSALLHIPNNREIWMFGAAVLSAGLYLVFSAPGVSFWSEFVATNTSVLGFSMMFYMLFVSEIITCFLTETEKTGCITTTVLGVADGLYLLVPVLTEIRFYDTWLPWVITQSIANAVLCFCLIRESRGSGRRNVWKYTGMALLMAAFAADAIATAAGAWKGGLLSKCVFFLLFITALFFVLRILPESINAAENARELELQRSRLEAEKNIVEAELKESRISIMLSQIRPHFIYNTLGTIERMCLKDPQQAFELVRNFSLYLRGNFSEIDSVIPIRVTQELQHVQYYVNIEKVRFPDMNMEYDVQATDFVLPALSVQPLVENAIKHGLMRLETGGSIVIRTYETPTHYCVEVEDDGVGFDTELPVDGKKHVGMRNIRERLKAMVNGELIMESKLGVGTKAVIRIPKEVTQ